jgi:hypothetical protein
MAELKTKQNKANVADFLKAIDDPKKRTDSFAIHEMMQEITGDKGSMWGSSIVGYGRYRYVYASGREGDWMATGFSPRKNALTLYLMSGFKKFDEELKKLGKFKTGVGCLYIKKLEDVDEKVLRQLISNSVSYIKEKYG